MYEEVVFADDLNAYKVVSSSTTLDLAMESLGNVQKELHRWGAANQVSFDPGKESKHVLPRSDSYGQDFKLLGVVFASPPPPLVVVPPSSPALTSRSLTKLD